MADSVRKIPAFLNAASGTAKEARAALEADPAFELHETAPDGIEEAVRAAMKAGAARVLVAGGDGSVAAAASAVCGEPTELAVLPGGTLNHFARDLGISTDAKEALDTASSGTARPVDAGKINERLFLNTSSVGAYVHFVRVREYLEPMLGYRIASFIAALRALFQLRLLTVELEVDGERRRYITPIVFIGVGERELKAPTLGNRVKDGRSGLHVLVVRGRTRGGMVALGLNAVARGIKTVARTPKLDSFIVDRCTISRRREGRVSIDGELVKLGATLEYELVHDAIQVVAPA